MGARTTPAAEGLAAPATATDRLDADPRWLTVVAVLVGAALPGAVAVVAWWLGVFVVAAIALAGVPIGGIAAGLLATRVVRADWVSVAIGAGLVAPFAAMGMLGVAAAVDSVVTRVLNGLAGVDLVAIVRDLGVLLAGVAYVALYALLFGVPVTVPSAFVVAVTVRRLGRAPRRRSITRAVLLAVITATAGMGTLLVAGPLAGSGLGPVDWAARSAAVRLTWAIENRTATERSLALMADLGDGSSTGSEVSVGPCAVVRDRANLPSTSWTIRETDPTGGTFGEGPVIATSANAPGSDPTLLVVLGPGTGSDARPGGPLPDEGPVPAEACR